MTHRPDPLHRLGEGIAERHRRPYPGAAIAETLLRHLPGSPAVERVEIAGPGFINFFLTANAYHFLVPQILEQGYDPTFGARPLKRDIQRLYGPEGAPWTM